MTCYDAMKLAVIEADVSNSPIAVLRLSRDVYCTARYSEKLADNPFCKLVGRWEPHEPQLAIKDS